MRLYVSHPHHARFRRGSDHSAEEKVQAEKRKRKKTNKDNLSWNGKNQKKMRSNPSANPTNLFCANNTTVVNEAGDEQRYLHASIIDTSCIKLNDENISEETFNESWSHESAFNECQFLKTLNYVQHPYSETKLVKNKNCCLESNKR